MLLFKLIISSFWAVIVTVLRQLLAIHVIFFSRPQRLLKKNNKLRVARVIFDLLNVS
jgi:hypothetical protein